jgi:hypothetical protein
VERVLLLGTNPEVTMEQFIYNVFSKKEITEERILANIERKYKSGMFAPPMFTDENFAYGKGRLTAFRSDTEWILLFEYLVYIGEADIYENAIYCYGNKIKKHLYNKKLFELTTDDEDINPLDFEIIINSNTKRLRFSVEDYIKNGIDISKTISGYASFDNRLQILRILVDFLPPEDIFLSIPDLLKITGRPLTLPVFLQLYEWQHPDPRHNEVNFLSPCLRSLIKAIANNNPIEYECAPNLINTHWSYWPPFGLT